MTTLPSVGQRVLLLWNSFNAPEEVMKYADKLKHYVGEVGYVAVENVDRLAMSDHAKSSFDIVFCGTAIVASAASYSIATFVKVARLLKPAGHLIVRESVVLNDSVPYLRTANKLISALKLSGFVKIGVPETIPKGEVVVCDEVLSDLLGSDKIAVVEIRAEKPYFEVGSSVSIAPAAFSNARKMWILSGNNDALVDSELINEDDLLDEDDLKKPDPSTLRVCDTTRKRKACKNCSCGLAEELKNEKAATKVNPTPSSCGSCYLGDAFRCSSCPYLGMPAFKQGEKISLSDRQLKADA